MASTGIFADLTSAIQSANQSAAAGAQLYATITSASNAAKLNLAKTQAASIVAVGSAQAGVTALMAKAATAGQPAATPAGGGGSTQAGSGSTPAGAASNAITDLLDKLLSPSGQIVLLVLVLLVATGKIRL